jgi:hypothetical protein
VYRRHWKFLIPLSLVVLMPQAVADAVFTDVQITEVKSLDDVLTLASVPIAVAINLGGEALYAGIVAAAVVEWLRGNELRDVPGAARSIAYGRLIAVDLILALATTVGLVLLIVPGILVFTYLAVSPALIELNGVTVRESLRSSPRLVRGNFWRVLGFTLLVLLGAELFAALLESPIHGVHGEVFFHLLIEAVIEPFQGLTTVFLALALLGLHGHDDRLANFLRRRPDEG